MTITEYTTEGKDIENKITLFELGTVMYIFGRVATHEPYFMTPVHAILLHHAIEYFLKAALYWNGTSIDDLESKGHKIDSLANEYIKQFKNTQLKKKKTFIKNFNGAWNLRYPQISSKKQSYIQICQNIENRKICDRNYREINNRKGLVTTICFSRQDIDEVISIICDDMESKGFGKNLKNDIVASVYEKEKFFWDNAHFRKKMSNRIVN